MLSDFYSNIFRELEDDFKLIGFQYHPPKQKSSKIHSITELQSWFISSKGKSFELAFFEALEERGVGFFSNVEFIKNGIRHEVDAVILLEDEALFVELKSSKNITRINYIEGQWNIKNYSIFNEIIDSLKSKTNTKFGNSIDFIKIAGPEDADRFLRTLISSPPPHH
ncbi:MAG: hypothetical protein ACP5IB_07760 [Thermoplasmata archaeon]